MEENQNPDWQDKSTRHPEADKDEREKKGGFNWLPLLLIPVAFVMGWGANDATAGDDRNQISETRPQVGVGGGPDSSMCPSPNSNL